MISVPHVINSKQSMINSLHVNFWGRPSKTSRAIINIQVRITVNGQREEIGAANIKIPKSDWNSKFQKIKGQNALSTQLNLRLSTIKSDIVSIYNHFEVNKEAVSAAKIKAIYKGECKVRLNFNELFKEYKLANKHLSKNTLKGYKRRYLKLLQYVDKSIMPDEVKVKELNRLEHEMKKNSYSPAYIYKCKAAVKMLVDFGNDCGLISGHIIGKIKRKIKIDTTHLTIEELNSLTSLRMPSIQKDIDVFLIGCYTGMSFSDIMLFTKDKITTIEGKEYIKGNRIKSGTEYFLPLLPEAKCILEKYDYQLPKLYNKECNKNVRIALDVIGVTTYIKFHYSRKTFANYCLNHLLLSRDTTAKMMGQKCSKELDAYAKITLDRVIKETSMAA